MKNIRRLSLEEKVGQLFFLGFQGPTPDAETWELMERVRPCGFVFFWRNIGNRMQFCILTARLREPNGLPALLAIEHEGGYVDRLKQIFDPIPPMRELAALGTAPLRAGARIIASEIEAVGLNVDFAPVVDLAYPGSVMAERVLGSNPAEVGRLGGAVIDELSKKNIISCVKDRKSTR